MAYLPDTAMSLKCVALTRLLYSHFLKENGGLKSYFKTAAYRQRICPLSIFSTVVSGHFRVALSPAFWNRPSSTELCDIVSTWSDVSNNKSGILKAGYRFCCCQSYLIEAFCVFAEPVKCPGVFLFCRKILGVSQSFAYSAAADPPFVFPRSACGNPSWKFVSIS